MKKQLMRLKWIVPAVAFFGLMPVGCTSSSQATDSGAIATAKLETCQIAVEGMTCATCPIQVRTVMSRVDGVRDVDVSLKNKSATVDYDPTRTTPEKIAAAATDIGFPSTPKAN